MIEQPRFVDQGKVTTDTLSNTSAKILEINSKTGLYPLYVTYSIFRSKCDKYKAEELTEELQEKVWLETVKDNIFVICKTPMAKQITKRTLVGYKMAPVNAHYFDDLINMMKNKPENFVNKVKRPGYWDKEEKEMKFDAVVGNPPYQEITNGSVDSQSTPVYNYFFEESMNLNPKYVSMITPARWLNGGFGLDKFRERMLSDNRFRVLHDYLDELLPKN
jgi:tRNA1(Val) A37 N6-methylase TrmN6